MSQFSIIPLIHSLSTLLMLLFYMGAMVFVVSRKSDNRSAKSLAVTALALMFLTHLGSLVFNIWMSRSVSPSNAGVVISLFSIASSLCFAISVGMLVAAVFVRPPPTDQAEPPGKDGALVNSDNPYSPPIR